jgi:hypothetical protein
MGDLILSATVNTPQICFRNSGELLIKGRSLPEDVTTFYNPVLQWLRQFIAETVKLEIDIDYMNSSSTKKLLEIFKSIDKNSGVRNFYVNWLYDIDDEDALEKGLMMEEVMDKAIFIYQVSENAEC